VPRRYRKAIRGLLESFELVIEEDEEEEEEESDKESPTKPTLSDDDINELI
jgi:hypothetical protein